MFKKIFKIKPDNTVKIEESHSSSVLKTHFITPKTNIISDDNEPYDVIKKKYEELSHKYFELKRKNLELEENIKIYSLKDTIDEDSIEITAEVWTISVCEGIMGAIHADFKKINELYIPEWNVAINIHESKLNILSYDKLSKRYSNENKFESFNNSDPKLLKKITLSKELTNKLKKLVENHISVEKLKINLKDEIKELLT